MQEQGHRNTATPQHRNTATPQHRNTATPQHRNTATPQHRNTATPQHRNTATPQHRVKLLFFLTFFWFAQILNAQSVNYAYRIQYTKNTDFKSVKSPLDTTTWCETDFIETQSTHLQEVVATTVLPDGNFTIETQIMDDSQRKDWFTPIQKILFNRDGVKSFRPDGTLLAFQPFNDENDPYSEMYDSVLAGQVLGKLPAFPQITQDLIDEFKSQGYDILWQSNGDIWFQRLWYYGESHALKIQPSILQVENWYQIEGGAETITDFYQIMKDGDTLLRKTLTVDYPFLCSGACIKREKKEVYFNYLNDQRGAAVRSAIDQSVTTPLSILAYPNPCHDQFELKLNAHTQEYTVVLYDQQGTKVFEEKRSGDQNAIDISGLPAGCYTLQILFPERISRSKIIKI